MGGVIPPDEIKVGMRVAVVSTADEHCPHDIVWGVGVVTHKGSHTEVAFDDGNGGVFPHWRIRHPEEVGRDGKEGNRRAGGDPARG